MKPPYLCISPEGDLEIWTQLNKNVWFVLYVLPGTNNEFRLYLPYPPQTYDREIIDEWRE